jgi:hypothetical protein
VSSSSVVIHRFKVLSLSLGQRHPSHPPALRLTLPPLVTTGRRRRTTRLGTTSKRVFIFIKKKKKRNNTHPSCALVFYLAPRQSSKSVEFHIHYAIVVVK